jgi:hypothetical protein
MQMKLNGTMLQQYFETIQHYLETLNSEHPKLATQELPNSICVYPRENNQTQD